MSFSNTLEVLGLVAFAAGWGLALGWPAFLIVAGVLAVLYANYGAPAAGDGEGDG